MAVGYGRSVGATTIAAAAGTIAATAAAPVPGRGTIHEKPLGLSERLHLHSLRQRRETRLQIRSLGRRDGVGTQSDSEGNGERSPKHVRVPYRITVTVHSIQPEQGRDN